MLIKQPQIRIVSKPMRLATGEAVLAYFALINVEGHIEVRFLGTKTAPVTSAQEEAVLRLAEAYSPASHGPIQAPQSPYADVVLRPLLFLKSQFARAPSFC